MMKANMKTILRTVAVLIILVLIMLSLTPHKAPTVYQNPRSGILFYWC